MIRKLLRHVAYNFAEGGARQVIYKVFWRMYQAIWSSSVALVYVIRPGQEIAGRAAGLRHQILSFDDAVRGNYYKAIAFPERIRQRFTDGAVCHGLFLGSDLVNVGWTLAGALELNEQFIPMPGSMCIYDCFTVPDHRGKGIYRESLCVMIRHGAASGSREIVIAVDPANAPSIRAIEAVGFRLIYQLEQYRRFGVGGSRITHRVAGLDAH